MRKLILDLNLMDTPEKIQEYLEFEFEFREGYGRNLDALYDELTSITEDTCVGLFCPVYDKTAAGKGQLRKYFQKIKVVFHDAEEENEHLCVIFSELEDNFSEKQEICDED